MSTAIMISNQVGYDAAKQVKGRKRHLTVDMLGLVLRVLVTAASVPEREGGKRVLKKVKQMGKAVRRAHSVWVDVQRSTVLPAGHCSAALGHPGSATP